MIEFTEPSRSRERLARRLPRVEWRILAQADHPPRAPRTIRDIDEPFRQRLLERDTMAMTRPEDIADLFGLPPEESTPSAAEAEEAARAEAAALAAEEAALAAELALAIASGDFATDAPDSRAKLRVEVSWPARMHLPGGRVIDLKVRNISEGGVGLMAADAIPGYTVVDFEMDVPSPAEGRPVTVKGTIRTTYAVIHGADFLCGATWMQVPPAGQALVNAWIDRLRP